MMNSSHGNMTFLMHIQRCALALLKITITTLYKFLYILLLSLFFNNIWLYDNYGKLKESQWKSYGLCLLIILSIKEFGLPVIVIVIMLGWRWRMWRVTILIKLSNSTEYSNNMKEKYKKIHSDTYLQILID